jgi:fatty acid desaturase
MLKLAPGRRAPELPTLAMMVATYAIWGIGTTVAWHASPALGFLLTTLAIAQFSSLQHEVLHGHPFADQRLNEALVFPGLTLVVPYNRFRDLHLAHHHDPLLTDPYDDPESNFMDPARWSEMPMWARRVYQMNNTLLGRILIGPALSVWALMRDDSAAIRRGNGSVGKAWVLQALGVTMVLAWLAVAGGMPFAVYAVAAYLAFGLLKIRTFLEHRAHESFRGRTVIIEDRGPLSLLFLNNNFHAVHHMHPTMPWYELPAKYAANRDHYLRRNEGYLYRSYAEIFRDHFLTAKDPVPHPLWTPSDWADQSNRRKEGTEPELSKNGTPG